MLNIFNKEKVDNILKELMQNIKIEDLNDSLSKDISEGNVKTKINNINKYFINKINQKYLPNVTKEAISEGLGNIAVLYNGNPNITLKLIILALRTNNKLTLITDNYKNANLKLNKILKNIQEKNNYNNEIIEIKNISQNKFLIEQKNYKKALFIGTKNEYIGMLRHLQIECTFYEYGCINVFLDKNISKEKKEILLNMDDYAFENDIEINYINISKFNENKEDYIRTIRDLNNFGERQNIAIFTEEIKKTYYFFNIIHAKNVYINKNPFNYDLLEFDEKEFIFNKKIIK